MPPKKSAKGKEKVEGNKEISPFVSDIAAEKWSKYERKGMIPGKSVKWTDFEAWDLRNLFEKVGLLKFFDIDEYVCSHLVRMFYCNLTLSKDGKKLLSRVNGTKIVLTVEKVCEIFEIPNTPIKLYFWPDGDFTEVVTELKIRRTICKKDHPQEQGLDHQDCLNDRAKLICRFLAHNVVPRAGHFGEVQPLQLVMVYAIVTTWKLNFGHIIFHHIANEEKRQGSLPYCAALTLVFKHFDVELDGEERFRMPRPFDAQTLYKMGVLTKRKKTAEEESREDEEDTGDDELVTKRDLRVMVTRLQNVDSKMDMILDLLKKQG